MNESVDQGADKAVVLGEAAVDTRISVADLMKRAGGASFEDAHDNYYRSGGDRTIA